MAQKPALASGANAVPRSGRVIGPPHRPCQRPFSTNRRITSRILQGGEVPDFSGLHAVLEPQSCDVLTISIQRFIGCQWGLPVINYRGWATFLMNPSPVGCGRETSRDLHTVDVRDSGHQKASGSRTSLRVVRRNNPGLPCQGE